MNRNARTTTSRRFLALLCVLALGLLGAGCSYDGEAPGGGSPQPSSGGDLSLGPSPESMAAFQADLHGLLRNECAECHGGSGPGSPAIADPNADTAYSAIVDNQKVSLTNPASSRLVRRLTADFHYCWSDCADDGQEMLDAIILWADAVSSTLTTQVDEVIDSQSRRLSDGIIIEGQARFTGSQIALWEFKEGSGGVARDTSGVPPAMNLELSGEGVTWMSSYGLDFDGGHARASVANSEKLYDWIAAPGEGTQQYSVEAWVVPANVTQEGPAPILSYSNRTNSRNFTLGQVLYTYDYRNRSLAIGVGDKGTPSLRTYDADQDLQASLQHVVMTFDQYRGRRIYVNGEFTGDEDEMGGGRLWSWSEGSLFVLGNESHGGSPWEGKIQLAAVHTFALTDEQIRLNFAAGVGKRVVLRFDVSAWAGPETFLEFVVSEYDDYSYLFCEPTFITPNPTGYRVSNLRLAINGQVAVAGQAFNHIDAAITDSRQKLSSQCAVVAKDLGPDDDDFSVEFEVLGGFSNPIISVLPTPVPPVAFVSDLPLEGFRDFARIRDTMAAVTGVDANSANVRDTFDELRQQLPSTPDLRAFGSSHQTGISKLALEYCDSLVESTPLREAFFGTAFDFGAVPSVAFGSTASRDLVIDPLLDGMLGIAISNQPSPAEMAPLLDALIDDLTQVCNASACGAERTRTVVKASCAAVLSSAAVSVH